MPVAHYDALNGRVEKLEEAVEGMNKKRASAAGDNPNDADDESSDSDKPKKKKKKTKGSSKLLSEKKSELTNVQKAARKLLEVC